MRVFVGTWMLVCILLALTPEKAEATNLKNLLKKVAKEVKEKAPKLDLSGPASTFAESCTAYEIAILPKPNGKPALRYQFNIHLGVTGSGAFYSDASCTFPMKKVKVSRHYTTKVYFKGAPGKVTLIAGRKNHRPRWTDTLEVTISKPAMLTYSSNALNFGKAYVTRSYEMKVDVINSGERAATNLVLSSFSNGAFTIKKNSCASTLAAGKKCCLTIALNAPNTGAISDQLALVYHNGVQPFVSVALDVTAELVGLPGSFDLTFGNNGWLHNPADPNARDTFLTMAIQPDGKILGGGKRTLFYNGTTQVYDVGLIARFNVDGTLDTSFNQTGYVTTTHSTNLLAGARWWTLSVQSDGKIIGGSNSSGDVVLVSRFNPDGSADTGFGVGGTVTLPNMIDAFKKSVAVLADGRIVVVGQGLPEVGRKTLVVYRLNPDGSLDHSFGVNGKSVSPYTIPTRPNNFEFQMDGTLVTAATAYEMTATNAPLGARLGTILRVAPDGTMYPPVSDATAFNPSGVAIDSNNRILVTGDGGYGLERRFADGTLDSSFTRTAVPGTVATIAVQSNGSVLVFGEHLNAQGIPRYQVMRALANGGTDTEFGVNGWREVWKTGYSISLMTMLQQFDGKILIVGSAFAQSGPDVSIRHSLFVRLWHGIMP